MERETQDGGRATNYAGSLRVALLVSAVVLSGTMRGLSDLLTIMQAAGFGGALLVGTRRVGEDELETAAFAFDRGDPVEGIVAAEEH